MGVVFRNCIASHGSVDGMFAKINFFVCVIDRKHEWECTSQFPTASGMPTFDDWTQRLRLWNESFIYFCYFKKYGGSMDSLPHFRWTRVTNNNEDLQHSEYSTNAEAVRNTQFTNYIHLPHRKFRSAKNKPVQWKRTGKHSIITLITKPSHCPSQPSVQV